MLIRLAIDSRGKFTAQAVPGHTRSSSVGSKGYSLIGLLIGMAILALVASLTMVSCIRLN